MEFRRSEYLTDISRTQPGILAASRLNLDDGRYLRHCVSKTELPFVSDREFSSRDSTIAGESEIFAVALLQDLRSYTVDGGGGANGCADFVAMPQAIHTLHVEDLRKSCSS